MGIIIIVVVAFNIVRIRNVLLSPVGFFNGGIDFFCYTFARQTSSHCTNSPANYSSNRSAYSPCCSSTSSTNTSANRMCTGFSRNRITILRILIRHSNLQNFDKQENTQLFILSISTDLNVCFTFQLYVSMIRILYARAIKSCCCSDYKDYHIFLSRSAYLSLSPLAYAPGAIQPLIWPIEVLQFSSPSLA